MVKIALVGCGGIGTNHANKLIQIPDAKIVAAVDIIPERAEKVAELANAKAFTDYRDALPLADAVWVCTPPDSHRDISVDALNANKHVFCEKPMALSLEEADAMIEAAKTNDRLLGIGYCLRFLPWAEKCKEIVESGELGDITVAWIARMSSIPPAPWLKDQAASGGMLTEQTTHNLDWLRYVLGDVAEVTGLSKTALPDVTIQDNVVAVLKFARGTIGQIMASWSSASNWLESGLVGTKGVLRTGQGGPITVYPVGGEPKTYEPERIDMYLKEDEVFIDSIVNNSPYPLDPAEAKESLALSLAILKSAQTGQTITI
ncbi:MAG: Gfo/Idh/MocA family oxidoreductase [Firmicutes bacterium]|nr:Gfo/Idh/MocA family oxidoreductase [Bacillota bacterium]